MPTDHYPIPSHYPRTETSPAETTITCACGDFEWWEDETFHPATTYAEAWEEHVRETEENQ